jgi:hypothetical protein
MGGRGDPTMQGRPAGRLGRRRLLKSMPWLAPAVAVACGQGTGGPLAVPEQPTPTPPPTATPHPPTPTPVPYSPLTGRQVDDPATIRRRIVAVKIDNAPEARPQYGLGEAEVVYEQLAEGGLTRFLALYLQSDAERVGPVRSARLTDIYLGQEWEFLLAYAGAGRTTARLLADSLIPLFKAPELGERLEGTAYWRDSRRPPPYNLFVRVGGIRQAALREGGIAPEVEIHPFPFQEPPPEPGPLRAVNLPYIPAAAVTWRYDPEAQVWKRMMARAAHVDATTGLQLQVENVLIQYAQIYAAQHVEPDAAGTPALDTVLRGENKARLFHSGHMYEGTWWKEHDRAKTSYRQADGSPLPFRPGRVWIHIIPTDFQASWS